MYYAVKVGRNPGIYNNWDDCKKEVNGFSGAIYKKFNNRSDAEEYIGILSSTDSWGFDNNKESKLNPEYNEMIAYVDGSYRDSDKSFSYGIVIITQDNPIETLSKRYYDKPEADLRNVMGELCSSVVATRDAITRGMKLIDIRYDYAGIEKWVTGDWKANNDITRRYRDTMIRLSKQIKIKFTKVNAHTGDKYNEMADSLAKSAK